MLPYLVRMRGDTLPGMEEEEKESVYDESMLPPSVDCISNLSYTPKKKDKEPLGLDQWDKLHKR